MLIKIKYEDLFDKINNTQKGGGSYIFFTCPYCGIQVPVWSKAFLKVIKSSEPVILTCSDYVNTEEKGCSRKFEVSLFGPLDRILSEV